MWDLQAPVPSAAAGVPTMMMTSLREVEEPVAQPVSSLAAKRKACKAQSSQQQSA